MKYVLLTNENRVKEVIPEFNPDLPGIPVKERYAPDFLAQCILAADEVEVRPNMQYVPEEDTFIEYVPPAPAPQAMPEEEPATIETAEPEAVYPAEDTELSEPMGEGGAEDKEVAKQ